MQEPKYTMHNIVLPDGRQTIPGKPILSETTEVKAMIEFAKSSCPKGNMIIDLGAGEGGYSIAFARAGFKVTAVEPRIENIDKIKYACKPEDDIIISICTIEYFLGTRGIRKDDLVLCLGLLYHLPDPAGTLSDISKVSNALILSTHYAMEFNWQYDWVPSGGSWLLKRICKRFPFLFRRTHFGLSALTMHRGSIGRWYPEYRSGRTNIQSLTHSSFHNHKSFWLTASEIEGITQVSGLKCIHQEFRVKDQGMTGYYVK